MRTSAAAVNAAVAAAPFADGAQVRSLAHHASLSLFCVFHFDFESNIISNIPLFDSIIFKQAPTMDNMVQAAPDIPMDALMPDRVDVRSFMRCHCLLFFFINLITYFI